MWRRVPGVRRLLGHSGTQTEPQLAIVGRENRACFSLDILGYSRRGGGCGGGGGGGGGGKGHRGKRKLQRTTCFGVNLIAVPRDPWRLVFTAEVLSGNGGEEGAGRKDRERGRGREEGCRVGRKRDTGKNRKVQLKER